MKEQEYIFENQILTSVGEGYDNPNTLTGFMARRGRLYNSELMVVGRAVNGWISEVDACLAHEFLSAEKRVLFRMASQGFDGDNVCPMQWVVQNWINANPQEYSTNRSAFWRVIKSLVLRLNCTEELRVFVNELIVHDHSVRLPVADQSQSMRHYFVMAGESMTNEVVRKLVA